MIVICHENQQRQTLKFNVVMVDDDDDDDDDVDDAAVDDG